MTSSECRAAVRPEEKQLAAVCDHKYIRTNSNIWTTITKVSGQIHLDEYIMKKCIQTAVVTNILEQICRNMIISHMIIGDVSNLNPCK